MPEIFMIVAVNVNNNGIGYQGNIPWNIPCDLKHFSQITSQSSDPEKKNVIIMGSRTWDSLPKKPLSQRLNVVITNTRSSIEGAIVCKNIQHSLEFVRENEKFIDKVFIIGGERLYQEALEMNIVTKIYVTRIMFTYDVPCDCYFPYNQLETKYGYSLTQVSEPIVHKDIIYDYAVYEQKEKLIV
jgi:dihydrofolate reductase